MQFNLFKTIFLFLFAFGNILLNESSVSGFSTESSGETKVWICTGSSAYTYHSRRNCSGLSNCKGSIKQVTLEEAVKKYHRRPCKKCCGK